MDEANASLFVPSGTGQRQEATQDTSAFVFSMNFWRTLGASNVYVRNLLLLKSLITATHPLLATEQLAERVPIGE